MWTAHEIQGNGASHIFAEKSAKSERHLQEASMLQVAEEYSFNEHQNTTSIDVEQQKLNLPIVPQMLLRGVANWEHIYQKTLLKTSDHKFSFQLEFHHKRPMDQNTHCLLVQLSRNLMASPFSIQNLSCHPVLIDNFLDSSWSKKEVGNYQHSQGTN